MFKPPKIYYCKDCGEKMDISYPYGIGIYSELTGNQLCERMYTCKNRKWYHVGLDKHEPFGLLCEEVE